MIEFILLGVVVVLSISGSLVYVANKKIAANMHMKLVKPVDESGLKNSPYKIDRKYSSYSNTDIYVIKNGMVTIDTSTFYDLPTALKSMNELEKIGGYKQTKI
jgi:hypothetical protein